MLNSRLDLVSYISGRGFEDVLHPPRRAATGEPLVQRDTTHRNGVHPFHGRLKSQLFRSLQRLLLQEHVELQKLFVRQLLAAVGLQVLVEEGPRLIPTPIQLLQPRVSLCDQIAATNRHARLFGLIPLLQLPQLA